MGTVSGARELKFAAYGRTTSTLTVDGISYSVGAKVSSLLDKSNGQMVTVDHGIGDITFIIGEMGRRRSMCDSHHRTQPIPPDESYCIRAPLGLGHLKRHWFPFPGYVLVSALAGAALPGRRQN